MWPDILDQQLSDYDDWYSLRLAPGCWCKWGGRNKTDHGLCVGREAFHLRMLQHSKGCPAINRKRRSYCKTCSTDQLWTTSHKACRATAHILLTFCICSKLLHSKCSLIGTFVSMTTTICINLQVIKCLKGQDMTVQDCKYRCSQQNNSVKAIYLVWSTKRIKSIMSIQWRIAHIH